MDGPPEKRGQDNGIQKGIGMITGQQERTGFLQRPSVIDLHPFAVKGQGQLCRYFKELVQQGWVREVEGQLRLGSIGKLIIIS